MKPVTRLALFKSFRRSVRVTKSFPTIEPVWKPRTVVRNIFLERKIDIYAFATAFVLVSGAVYCLQARTVYAEAAPSQSPRKIRLAEVRQHGRSAESRWVVRGTRVYDITEWIPNHPGGEVILRAVGGVIDSYWNIFSIHQKQDVVDVLEKYYIGDLDEVDLIDGHVPQDDVEDPFEHDPKRDPSLRVLSERPCNAETPHDGLKEFITGNDVFCKCIPNYTHDENATFRLSFCHELIPIRHPQSSLGPAN
jgi:cytochrome b involved in lipid metabolism